LCGKQLNVPFIQYTGTMEVASGIKASMGYVQDRTFTENFKIRYIFVLFYILENLTLCLQNSLSTLLGQFFVAKFFSFPPPTNSPLNLLYKINQYGDLRGNKLFQKSFLKNFLGKFPKKFFKNSLKNYQFPRFNFES
jgi:hypothetical protein